MKVKIGDIFEIKDKKMRTEYIILLKLLNLHMVILRLIYWDILYQKQVMVVILGAILNIFCLVYLKRDYTLQKEYQKTKTQNTGYRR